MRYVSFISSHLEFICLQYPINISFEYLVSMSLLGVGYMLTPIGSVPQRVGNTCLLIHVSVSMKPCFGSLI
jgi:hypothetical protein